MRDRTLSTAILVTMLLACSGGPVQRRVSPSDNSFIRREELSAINSDNLYNAVEKLRPEWLTSRGPISVSNANPSAASVFMNGQMLGKIDYLRFMQVIDVTEIRYWSAAQASARFGMGHPRGVIELIRR